MCGKALKKSNRAVTASSETECAGIVLHKDWEDILDMHLKAFILERVSNSSTFCKICLPGTKPLCRSEVHATVTGARLEQEVALTVLLSVHNKAKGLVSLGVLTTTLELGGSEGRGFLVGKCHIE